MTPCFVLRMVLQKWYSEEVCFKSSQFRGGFLSARIYVADEDTETLEATGAALREHGYNVSSFDNPQKIIDAVANKAPDLLLVGLGSGSKTTQSLCRRFKSDVKTSHIPILLAGNQRQLNKLIDSIDYGVDGYFIKPVNTDELLAKIKSFVRLKATQQELITANQLLEKKERELAERNNELENIYEISQKLTRCLDLDKVLGVLFKKAHKLLHADRCFLQLVFEDDKKVSELFKTHVDFGEIKHRAMSIEKEGLLIKQAIKDKAPIIIQRAKANHLVNKVFAYRYNLKTVLFVPLISKDNVIGMLLICRDKPGEFIAEHIRLAQIIGSEAAFSIERAQLYEKTKDLHSTLKAIVDWGDSALIMVDQNGRVGTANKKFCELMGLEAAEIIGKNEQKHVLQKVKHLFKDPESFESRFEWLSSQSSEVVNDTVEMVEPRPRALERFSGPVFDASGDFMGRVNIYHDITTRKQSERRIKNLYRRERKIAQILQRNLLPKELPDLPGYEIGTKYAAAVQGMVIGGDYYDFIPLKDKDYCAFAIGDVCGKGMQAAVQTYLVKYSLRAFAREDPSPSVVISRINWTFCQEVEDGAFVTLAYGLLDHRTDTLQYCIAGHPIPVVYRHAKEDFEMLKSNGSIVGVIPDTRYDGSIIRLKQGDVAVFYTDGITEARNADGFFGEEKLKEIIKSSADMSAQAVADKIFGSVSRFTSNHLNDDAAVIVLKKTY